MGMGKAPSAPAQQTVTQVNEIPAFLEKAYQEAIDRARAVSQEEMPVYEGQRVADFSAPTEQAFQLAQQGIGQYNPTYNAGVGSTLAASETFNPDEFAKFNDPYRAQVVDEIARLGNRNFAEKIMPGINDQFTGAGMFGSSRNAEILGRAARDTQADITGKQQQALSEGFNQSMSNYMNAMNRKIAAGGQLSNQAAQGQQMFGTDVNVLRNIGQAQEGREQSALDTAYNQFLEQRDYPKANVQFFSDIARGISNPNLVTSQTQTLSPQANPWNQAIGAGVGLYQAQQTGRGFKKGGHVKAKDKPKTTKKATKRKNSAMSYGSSMSGVSGGIGGMYAG